MHWVHLLRGSCRFDSYKGCHHSAAIFIAAEYPIFLASPGVGLAFLLF